MKWSKLYISGLNKNLRFGMCKLFSGFMHQGKVLVRLIHNMDRQVHGGNNLVTHKFCIFFIYKIWRINVCGGGNRSLFLLAKHTVEKELSACRSMLEPFSLFLLWLFLLPSIPCWRFTWAAVGYRLQASVLMPKGCKFVLSPTVHLLYIRNVPRTSKCDSN